MKKPNKSKVYETYDIIHEWIDEHRNKSLIEKEYLDLILKSLPPGGSILDLGCGTGEPLAQFFIERGFKVTGVDGSHKMIERCQKRFPDQRWILSDMCDVHLGQQFDAILAWNSFFHLEQDRQRDMFKIFDEHSKPGSLLAFTSGVELGEVWGDNGGQMLYHASLSSEEYQSLLQAASFQVLVHKIEDPQCGDATIWVAVKV